MIKQILAVWLTVALTVPALAQPLGRVYQEPNTGISFPAQLGPLHYGGETDYAQKGRPDLGISVRYSLPGSPLRADIFLYDLGKKNLGTGTGSPEVARIFQQSIGDIFSLEKKGDYKDVRMLSEGKTALKTSTGPLALLQATLSYSQLPAPHVSYPGPQISNLYFTAYGDYFLKIRFSYPVDDRRVQHEMALEQFLADLAKILLKHTDIKQEREKEREDSLRRIQQTAIDEKKEREKKQEESLRLIQKTPVKDDSGATRDEIIPDSSTKRRKSPDRPTQQRKSGGEPLQRQPEGGAPPLPTLPPGGAVSGH